MSLIYSAMREISPSISAGPSSNDRMSPKSNGRTQHLLLVFSGAALVLLSAAALWFLWQSQKGSLLTPREIAPSPIAKISSIPDNAKVILSEPMQNNANAQTTAPAVNLAKIFSEPLLPVTKKTVKTTESGNKNVIPATSTSSASGSLLGKGKKNIAVIAEKSVPENEIKPLTLEVSIEDRFSLLLQTTKKNDLVGALEHLKTVQSQLPPTNILRLRAEAWFALKNGDDSTARRAYTDILERTNFDEEASINLASIETRASRREAARQILAEALRNRPDSEALRAALNRFNAPAGN
jgi:hypothetical protein